MSSINIDFDLFFKNLLKYTKPPECVDIIRCTSRGALEARVCRTSAVRASAGKTE